MNCDAEIFDTALTIEHSVLPSKCKVTLFLKTFNPSNMRPFWKPVSISILSQKRHCHLAVAYPRHDHLL